MTTIYFDNAATSWPKPKAVRSALDAYFGDAGGNPGRSGHRMSVAAARIVEDARDRLAEIFNVTDPSHLVFTQNATHALNLALYGLLRPGDHVVTTSIEHNSVMRPLRDLEKRGVDLTIVSCTHDGTVDLNRVGEALRPDTRLLVTTHGSNVAGTLNPIGSLADLARERGIFYLVDAAQTAGAIPIDIQGLQVDLMAFTGHKGLLGPTGTGGLYIHEGVPISPLIRGGTGSDSAHDSQPEFLPDMFESGTPNVAGIAGLAAGARFLLQVGIETVRAHEQALMAQFLAGVQGIGGMTLYGPGDAALVCGTVSFNVDGAAPSDVAEILDQTFGIMARSGLHCCPSAHHTLGTFPTGTVRFSFGWFNAPAEVEIALEALREITLWAQKGLGSTGGLPPKTSWTA